MNKKLKRIIQGVLFVAIIGAFIYIGTRDFSAKLAVDNERFDSEYSNVNKDNVFVYANASDIYSKFKNGSAIVFMGFPSNKWSGYYASLLNQAAKETGVEEILYYDFKEDREQKNGTYQSIVLKLANYTPITDVGLQDIYAPTLVIIKNGVVIAFDNETAINKGNITPEQYWNEFNQGIKLNNFRTMFQDYLKTE